MAKKEKEKKALEKKQWVSSFNLVGVANVSDYTFSMDQKSEKSDWIYHRMNLQVDCGEKHGKVSAQMMGGFGEERDNVIFVHGKDDKGNDDFKNTYTIDFDDRFDESILEDIGSMSFLTVGLERDSKDKVFYKKFLTPYDAIAYIQEHLEDGMVVNVKGNLKYQLYNDSVTCQKEITSIALSSAEPDKYRATFIQTMLIDNDSATKNDVDKEKSVINVSAYILEKFKEFNNYDLTSKENKGGIYVPLMKNFEFAVNIDKPDTIVGVLNKIFKVKKGVDQITFEGYFTENGAAVTTTEDDLPDDIKELIDLGLYTLEEALARCSTNGAKEKRMILTKPAIKLVGEEDNKTPVVQRIDNIYEEEDLMLDCLVKREDEELPFEDISEPDESDVSSDADSEDDELEKLLAALD